MTRTYIALAGLAIVLTASLLHAAPSVSVVSLGINPSGNREWSVRVSPDANLFSNPPDSPNRGVGGSLAVELALSVIGSDVGDVDVNSLEWAYANPGSNPFTGVTSVGLWRSDAGGGGEAASDSENGGGSFCCLLGDYNEDGAVAAEDFTVWQDNRGGFVSLPNEAATFGFVTQEDYDVWTAHFGEIIAAGAGASGSTSTMFASFGSNFLNGTTSVELLTIETLGTGLTTVAWGGLASGYFFSGSRVAQAGISFDGNSGSVTVHEVPEPASIALALLVAPVGTAILVRRRRRARTPE